MKPPLLIEELTYSYTFHIYIHFFHAISLGILNGDLKRKG